MRSDNSLITDEEQVREQLNYVALNEQAFDEKNCSKSYAKCLHENFKNWLDSSNTIIRGGYMELLRYGQVGNPQEDKYVFWGKNRLRYAAALLLHSVIPHYRFYTAPRRKEGLNSRGHYHKHGELLLALLDSLVNCTTLSDESLNIIKINWYWDDKMMHHLKKATELLEMTDDRFMSLGDHDIWFSKL